MNAGSWNLDVYLNVYTHHISVLATLTTVQAQTKLQKSDLKSNTMHIIWGINAIDTREIAMLYRNHTN